MRLIAGWLEAAQREPDGEVDAALRQLNRALRAHRVATGDPFVREVAGKQALVMRLGWGRGEQVADGRWSEAVELPEPRRQRLRREAALRPQERLAALLGGREEPLACEELVLRARADTEAGRPREAALQVRVALEAALAELEADRHRSDMDERLEELADLRPKVELAANAALAGTLNPEAAAGVDRAVERLEAALRARTAAR